MSDSTDERSPGFNQNLTGKLIIAGLFVVLGTAGVAYYIKYHKGKSSIESGLAKLAAGENSDVETTPGDTPPKLNAEPGDSKQEKTPASNSFNGGFQANTSSSKRETATTLPSFNSASNGFNTSKQTSSSRIKTQRPATQLPPSRSFASTQNSKPQSSSFNSGGGGNFAAPNTSTSNASAPQVLAPKVAPIVQPSGNLRDRLSNGIQKVQQNTRQFAGDAANSLKNSTNNFAASAKNAIRQPTEKLGNAISNNFGGGSNNGNGFSTNQGFSNGNRLTPSPNSAPRTVPQQSNFPPVTPAPSFDKSRELKPFGSSGGNSASNLSLPPRNASPIGSQGSQFPAVRQVSPPSNLVRSNSPPDRGFSAQPGNRSRNQIANNNSKPRRRNTLATPGDRKLEGMQSPSVTIEKIAPREIQVNTPSDF
ncbi:MAG: hypothetical protein AAGA30_07365, partial [Planctomycetota bacterium]